MAAVSSQAADGRQLLIALRPVRLLSVFACAISILAAAFIPALHGWVVGISSFIDTADVVAETMSQALALFLLFGGRWPRRAARLLADTDRPADRRRPVRDARGLRSAGECWNRSTPDSPAPARCHRRQRIHPGDRVRRRRVAAPQPRRAGPPRRRRGIDRARFGGVSRRTSCGRTS